MSDAVFLHSATLGSLDAAHDDERLAPMLEQRRNLYAALQRAGAQLEPLPLPRVREHLFAKDRVVWCDDGWGMRALVCRPDGDNEQIGREWSRTLATRGIECDEVGTALAGTDVVIVPGRGALLGVGNASSCESAAALERFLGMDVLCVPLADARFARLDMAVAALDDGTAFVCRHAFDPRTYRLLRGWLGEAIEVPLYDALEGGLRFVQVGSRVVMGHGAPLVQAMLARRGMRVDTLALERVQRFGRGPACLVAKRQRANAAIAQTVSA